MLSKRESQVEYVASLMPWWRQISATGKSARRILQDADDRLFAEPARFYRPSPDRRTLASEQGQSRG
jgi:hypothetical protein